MKSLVAVASAENFVFPSRTHSLGHLSTRQYAGLIDEWVMTVSLDKREYGTHSLRRSKVSRIYYATGNLRAVQILLGHTNIENAVRCLGVDIDDALTLSERTEILAALQFRNLLGGGGMKAVLTRVELREADDR